MSKNMKLAVAFLGVAVLWIPQFVSAWPSDPTVNVPICTVLRDQRYPTLVNDHSGGAIITWEDKRSDLGNIYSQRGDIYAQRVDASGAVQWTANGVAVCTASRYQGPPKVVSDGSGGAIITWADCRSGDSDIYAQRVDTSGTVQWATDGVPICTASDGQVRATIVSDGSGGAIITWYDYRRSSAHDIYAQRVDASGTVRWTADGVAICTAPYSHWSSSIVNDGSGGAIITWVDYRSETSYDIYAQRMDASGAVQWTANGVAICTASGDQGWPRIASDGCGGAIITWVVFGITWDIYAQRVDASGTVQWTTNGVPICTDVQEDPTIVSDGAGGAIIIWQDDRGNHIYAQRVDASGAVQWTTNGVPICTANYQYDPTIVSYGSGGAIITWRDCRISSSSCDYNIYAQRVDASGAVQWTADGVPICTASRWQESPAIVSDGSGGAIITWCDRRGNEWDVYAQRVFSDGKLSSFTAIASEISLKPDSYALFQNFPNPFNPQTTITYQLPKASEVKLTVYNTAGQLVKVLVDEHTEAGHHTLLWDARGLGSGLYLYRLKAGPFTRTRKMVKIE